MTSCNISDQFTKNNTIYCKIGTYQSILFESSLSFYLWNSISVAIFIFGGFALS